MVEFYFVLKKYLQSFEKKDMKAYIYLDHFQETMKETINEDLMK